MYSLGIIGTGAGRAENNQPPVPIREITQSDFSSELIETRLVTFPSTPYDRGLTVMSYIDCAIEGVKNKSYDGLFLNTVGDYGITEIRSAVDCLVVGAAEATFSVSSNIGKKFSIVSIWPPKMNFIYHERLKATGADVRCCSIRNVLPNNDITSASDAGSAIVSMEDKSSGLIKKIISEINKAIEEDGADHIISGCTCMAGIWPELVEHISVPILEPMRCGYSVLQSMVGLKLMHSNIAYPPANPRNLGVLDSLIMGRKDLTSESTDCEVCVLS